MIWGAIVSNILIVLKQPGRMWWGHLFNRNLCCQLCEDQLSYYNLIKLCGIVARCHKVIKDGVSVRTLCFLVCVFCKKLWYPFC